MKAVLIGIMFGASISTAYAEELMTDPGPNTFSGSFVEGFERGLGQNNPNRPYTRGFNHGRSAGRDAGWLDGYIDGAGVTPGPVIVKPFYSGFGIFGGAGWGGGSNPGLSTKPQYHVN